MSANIKIPALEELKALRQWVVSGPDKTPIGMDKTPGAQVKPETWGFFEQAAAFKKSGGFAHLGFALDPATGMMFVDCDDCVTDGTIAPWAQEIIDRLNSYSEFSQSGNGIHIICRGALPDNIGAYRPKVYGQPDPTKPLVPELYDHARWMVVTGNHIPGTVSTIENRQRELLDLYNLTRAKIGEHKAGRHKPDVSPSVNGNGHKSDDFEAIKSAYTFDRMVSFAQKLFGNETEPAGGGVRILGNGGLIIHSKPEPHFVGYSDETGGDVFNLAALALFGRHKVDGKEFVEAAKLAADFVGLALPEMPQPSTPQTSVNPAQNIFKRLSLADLISHPKKEWLIDGFLGRGDLAMIFGDPETGKTFVTIDMIFDALLARPFAAKFNIARSLSVAFATSEGRGGLPQRFCAAANKHQIELDQAADLHIFLDTPQLFDDQSPYSIYNFIAEWKQTNRLLDLLIVDTLHGSSLGADENSSRDGGTILKAVKFARDALPGLTVLLVHHANRQGSYRGTSALHGALDAMYQTRRLGEIFAFECFKQKDAERFPPLYFRLTSEHYSQSVYPEWLEADTIGLDLTPPKSKIDRAKDDVLTLLADKPGLSQSDIVTRITAAGRSTIIEALKALENEGSIVTTLDSLKNKKLYHLAV